MDGGSMASITDGDHTFAWRFEQEPQPILAAVRTGLQMQKERLIQMARAIPKFVGRTLEIWISPPAGRRPRARRATRRRGTPPCAV